MANTKKDVKIFVHTNKSLQTDYEVFKDFINRSSWTELEIIFFCHMMIDETTEDLWER